MLLEDHEKITLEKFGKKFSKIHVFLDQYFPTFGPYHRILLHHQKGVDLIVEKFGEHARSVAQQHIINDQGRIPQDWRDFDFDLDNADFWLSKKTKLELGSLKNKIKKLYPGEVF